MQKVLAHDLPVSQQKESFLGKIGLNLIVVDQESVN